MAKLEIYVTADGENTVSQFYVSKSEHLDFNNMGDKTLTIVVKNPVGVNVLCEKKNDKDPRTSFPVPAKDAAGGPGKVKMYICDSYEGDTFTYSAEIEGKGVEDPIIIIGKDSANPWVAANVPILATGVALGIVFTLVALRLFRKQRPA